MFGLLGGLFGGGLIGSQFKGISSTQPITLAVTGSTANSGPPQSGGWGKAQRAPVFRRAG